MVVKVYMYQEVIIDDRFYPLLDENFIRESSLDEINKLENDLLTAVKREFAPGGEEIEGIFHVYDNGVETCMYEN